MIVFLNGRYLPAADAAVSIEDRGFLAGDGVFETALLHRGGFFRLREHLERFAASAATLRIPAPPSDELDAIIRTLARDNGLTDGNLRITLTRGVREPTLLVAVRPPDQAWRDRAQRGWHVVTARTRRPSTASVPAQLKALGRTYALLARLEIAHEAATDDVLLLTDDGFICEGPTWNVFWRSGSDLFTPALDLGVLAGVTRSVVIELARARGLGVTEGAWPPTELLHADEIFATMTSVGLVPFRSFDGRALPTRDLLADELQPLFWQQVDREAAADPL